MSVAIISTKEIIPKFVFISVGVSVYMLSKFKTIKTINELDFIKEPAIHILMRNLGEISRNINSFIDKLQNEITKMNKPRTTIVKGMKIIYKTMEEKKGEERRQGQLDLAAYRESPHDLIDGINLD